MFSSNNTNKLSPQEPVALSIFPHSSSNNTNKLSPQELAKGRGYLSHSSNNTNKLSPQEHTKILKSLLNVQIIQINLVLKNCSLCLLWGRPVQIIQINLVLKNPSLHKHIHILFK